MGEYYHVTSKAHKTRLIFETDQDFIAGVNELALCILKFNVTILAFCLMSNHFHFILKGHRKECMAFINEYKRMLSFRIYNNRRETGILRNVEIHIDELTDMEYLMNAIAYVLRNPVAARVNMMPYYYRWSSIGTYFRGALSDPGDKLNDLSLRKRIAIVKSRRDIPDGYRTDMYGMILPSCFVDYSEVESIFRYPSVFLAFLAKKVETEFEVRTGIAEMITYNDVELTAMINRLVNAEFGVKDTSQLSSEDRMRLCRLVRRNFGASVKQIARILRVPHEVVLSIV